MSIRQRRGCLGTIPRLLLLCIAIVYGVAAVTSPWSFHIGGRWTPLLYWSGYGRLATKTGTYPLYVLFYPSPHFSHLKLDGLRPTGGLQGTGALCTSPGLIQQLKLSGTIFGGWRSTEGSIMNFRLLEKQNFKAKQHRGFFDLYGRWQGSELVMDDRGRVGDAFPMDLRLDRASVRLLQWGSYSDFNAVCASGVGSPPAR